MEGGQEKLCCSARNERIALRGRKFRKAVAGRRSRRSRSSIRHASSSREGRGLLQWSKGYGNGSRSANARPNAIKIAPLSCPHARPKPR
ncbi:hypothetical protein REMIM1_PE00091 (plasmid) [Rhizobium etli bv. mimosae str. Mim1]|nr:hypothetical protein REMIM1_PE00091 [Rhizobium etli bv. mimosae str. Mim1]